MENCKEQSNGVETAMNERTNCENGFRNKAKVIFQLLHFTLNCSTGQSCEN